MLSASKNPIQWIITTRSPVIYLDDIIEGFSILPLEFTLNFQHINLRAGDHNPDQDLITGSFALEADLH